MITAVTGCANTIAGSATWPGAKLDRTILTAADFPTGVQYDRLIEASAGYVSHTLKGFGDHPVWTKDPRVAVFKDVGARGRSIAYAGKLGYAAAGVLADDVVIDLFADVVSGQMPAKDAIAKAEKRLRRHRWLMSWI